MGAQDDEICRYVDLLVSSSVGSWQERFDSVAPNTDFLRGDDNGVGNLIDGNKSEKLADYWFNHGDMATAESPAVLVVKLPRAASIARVVLNNTVSRASNSKYSVKYSTDVDDHATLESIAGETWKNLPSNAGSGSIFLNQEVVVDLIQPIEARYIRVELVSKEKNVTLNEIEVHGTARNLCGALVAEAKEVVEDKDQGATRLLREEVQESVAAEAPKMADVSEPKKVEKAKVQAGDIEPGEEKVKTSAVLSSLPAFADKDRFFIIGILVAVFVLIGGYWVGRK